LILKRLFLFVPILFGLLFLGLLTFNGELVALMMPFLIYLGAGLLYGPEEVRLKVLRTLSYDRVSQGEPIIVRLEVTNEGSRLEEILLEDLVPIPYEQIDGATSLLTSLESAETVHWEYTLRASRGHYWFQGVRAKANDHSGLFRKQETYQAEGRITVFPYAVKLKQVTIRPRRTRVYSGSIPARLGGQGVEFFGVREYQQCDPLRLINWKATARHPRAFFTNEFEQERAADVGLILDARRRCYLCSNEESLFEYAVSVAAALAEVFLNDGNRVGMLIYGRFVDWTFPGYGKVQKEHILQALARAKLGVHSVFDKLEHLPTRLFPSHSQLIFITPPLKDDRQTLFRLRARGYQVLVISPDPINFEERGLRSHPDFEVGRRIALLERTLMLRELRQAGVQVLNWPVNTPFHHVVSSSLIRQPFLSRNLKVI
jgi:uncharacterized protein (DUF58 family)